MWLATSDFEVKFIYWSHFQFLKRFLFCFLTNIFPKPKSHDESHPEKSSFCLNLLCILFSLPLQERELSFPSGFRCLFYHYFFLENISKYIHVVIPPFLTQEIVIYKHHLHLQFFVFWVFGHVMWLVGS